MPIRIEMIRDNRVVLQTYTDPLKHNEMVDLRNQMHTVILPASLSRMHVIADFRAIKNLPRSILTMGVDMLRRPHANTGSIMCVTSIGFITSMATIFARLSSDHPVKVVKTLEDALTEIDALLCKAT